MAQMHTQKKLLGSEYVRINMQGERRGEERRAVRKMGLFSLRVLVRGAMRPAHPLLFKSLVGARASGNNAPFVLHEAR